MRGGDGLIVFLILPTLPLWILAAIICKIVGYESHGTSGGLGLMLLISLPLGIISWPVIIYELVKHVSIHLV